VARPDGSAIQVAVPAGVQPGKTIKVVLPAFYKVPVLPQASTELKGILCRDIAAITDSLLKMIPNTRSDVYLIHFCKQWVTTINPPLTYDGSLCSVTRINDNLTIVVREDYSGRGVTIAPDHPKLYADDNALRYQYMQVSQLKEALLRFVEQAMCGFINPPTWNLHAIVKLIPNLRPMAASHFVNILKRLQPYMLHNDLTFLAFLEN